MQAREQEQVLEQVQVQEQVLEQGLVQAQVQGREQELEPERVPEQEEPALASLALSCREHEQSTHPKTQHRISSRRLRDKTPRGSIFRVSGSTGLRCTHV